MSPIETSPASWLPSITGRWRMRFLVMSAMHASTVVSMPTLIRSFDMISCTSVLRDARPCSATLRK